MRRKNEVTGIGEILYAVCMSMKDIVSEIKTLRNKNAGLNQIDINLATSGVVTCPKCGASFEKTSSVCQYCGYVSMDRDQMLEKIRREQRSIGLQIEDEQHQLKKILIIPILIVIPFVFGIGAFLLIQLIGFLMMNMLLK